MEKSNTLRISFSFDEPEFYSTVIKKIPIQNIRMFLNGPFIESEQSEASIKESDNQYFSPKRENEMLLLKLKKYEAALEQIANYKNHLPLPILYVEFKCFAISTAKDALEQKQA